MSVTLGLCLQPAKIHEVLSHIPNLLLQLVHQGYTCADSVCMSEQAFFTWRLHACVHDHITFPIIKKGEYWSILVARMRKLISGRYWIRMTHEAKHSRR